MSSEEYVEDIKEMRKRHDEEIENLQKNCPHDNVSEWMDYQWAPGHFGGEVKCCLFCGTIVSRRGFGFEAEVSEDGGNTWRKMHG